MKSFRLTLFALFATGGFALAAQAQEVNYTLDPGHTEVIATWTHLGFSQPSAMFDHIEGTLAFDQEHPETARLSVKVPLNSVHTASDGLDEHLQKADFFEVDKYPVATFTSTKVERGSTPDSLRVTGDLELHGTTQPLTLDVKVTKVGVHPMAKVQAAGFTATATLKRSDWGIKNHVPMISDDIRLVITTEAMAAKAE